MTLWGLKGRVKYTFYFQSKLLFVLFSYFEFQFNLWYLFFILSFSHFLFFIEFIFSFPFASFQQISGFANFMVFITFRVKESFDTKLSKWCQILNSNDICKSDCLVLVLWGTSFWFLFPSNKKRIKMPGGIRWQFFPIPIDG